MDFNLLISHPEWLLLVLAPLFFICMALEWFFGDRLRRLPENAAIDRRRFSVTLCWRACTRRRYSHRVTAGQTVFVVIRLAFVRH